MFFSKFTKLSNTAEFLEAARTEMRQSPEDFFYLMYFEIQDIWYIKRRYGNALAESILYIFGKYLNESQNIDIFCNAGWIIGSEFVILSKFTNKDNNQGEIQCKCMDFMKEYKVLKEFDFVTIKSGICAVESLSIEQALDNARNTCQMLQCLRGVQYQSKFFEFNPEVDIVYWLRTALQKQEIEVYLQPQCRLSDGKIVSTEALARWKGKCGKCFLPNQFIPVIEKTKMILFLDIYIIKQVLRILMCWQKEGKPVVPIAVNISRVSLADKYFVTEILQEIQNSGIDKMLINIEVTESAFLDDTKTLKSNLEILNKAGILVALDDFGTGYSNFNMIGNTSVDVIKIDKSFLERASLAQSGRVLLKRLIQFISDLNFTIICEGIETEEDRKFLEQSGCKLGQGYYFSKPVPVDQFKDTYLFANAHF